MIHEKLLQVDRLSVMIGIIYACVFRINFVVQRKFGSEIKIMNDGTIKMRISVLTQSVL
jgi:hypothetical protein